MKKFISLPVILLVLFSCKKNDTKAPTKADYLTAGTWMVTAAVTDDDGDGTYETNEFESFDQCYKDNIWTFKSDGTLQMDEGASKCDPGDAQTNTALWKLTNNDTSLLLASDTYSVIQLDANLIVLKLDYGANRSSKVTFSKR